MTFKGFNLEYPEYEVITPQTKHSFTVRSLNVQEEEKLKGSLVTPTKIADHLNSCIFDSVVKKPEGIDSLDSFVRSLTLKDRDALLYGLFHITYEEIRNYQVKCTACGNEYPITVQASSTFNFQAYPGKNILTDRIDVPLPVSKGVTAVVKQPTLFDEISALKELGNRPGSTIELITETLIIDRFTQDLEDKKEAAVYKDRIDIIDAYLTLAARDKRVIYSEYEKAFGNYGIELKMKSYCPSCSNEDVFDIDLVENFFRSLYSA